MRTTIMLESPEEVISFLREHENAHLRMDSTSGLVWFADGDGHVDPSISIIDTVTTNDILRAMFDHFDLNMEIT